ncbi:MAG: helix-turn-helix domain-containing protein [Micropepsaceae bacterium]
MSSRNLELRASIIVAARELFIANGFEKTSMTDIGKAVSVSKPTVYEHFDSKEAVMGAVVESALDELDMNLTKAAARGEMSFEEYINAMPDEFMRLIGSRTRSAMYRLLIQEGTRVPSIARMFASRITTTMYQCYYDLFARVMDGGECRRMEYDVARRMFMSPMNTVMLQIAMSGEASVNPELTRSFFDNYFRMLAQYLLLKRS